MSESDAPAQENGDGQVTLARLVAGAEKVLENATALNAEATWLRSAGALSRALLLHQISLEECAKIEMLGAHATSALVGATTDADKFARAFASHKAKNFTNAYMLPVGEDESKARREQRWDDAIAAFKEQQRAFHEDSNTAKNAALYVDMDRGEFTAPKEWVTATMVDAIADRNAQFLGYAGLKVRMLQYWQANTEVARQVLADFVSRFSELKTERDPELALSALMDALRARAEEIGYSGGVETEASSSPR